MRRGAGQEGNGRAEKGGGDRSRKSKGRAGGGVEEWRDEKWCGTRGEREGREESRARLHGVCDRREEVNPCDLKWTSMRREE